MGVCPDRRVVVRSINADQTDGAWGSAQTETAVPFLQKKNPTRLERREGTRQS